MTDDTNEMVQLDDMLRRAVRTAVDHDPRATKIWDVVQERIVREQPASPAQKTHMYASSMLAGCILSPCMQFTA